MVCVKPVLLKKSVDRQKYPRGLEVPCGKCYLCHQKKRSEWALRMLHELEEHKYATFLTLTYDDDHLPANASLSKYDLQNFFKRLRFNSKKNLRYFAAGEYGDNTYRPHYHAIVFGLAPYGEDADNMCWSWSKCVWSDIRRGKCIGSVTPESINYVAGYIGKTYYGDMQETLYQKQGREVPFKICSQGLGKNFAMKNEEIIRRGYLTRNGNKIAIPRYYLQKLNLTADDLPRDVINDVEKLMLEEMIGEKISLDDLYLYGSVEAERSVADKLIQSNKQRELNYTVKDSMRKAKL